MPQLAFQFKFKVRDVSRWSFGLPLSDALHDCAGASFVLPSKGEVLHHQNWRGHEDNSLRKSDHGQVSQESARRGLSRGRSRRRSVEEAFGNDDLGVHEKQTASLQRNDEVQGAREGSDGQKGRMRECWEKKEGLGEQTAGHRLEPAVADRKIFGTSSVRRQPARTRHFDDKQLDSSRSTLLRDVHAVGVQGPNAAADHPGLDEGEESRNSNLQVYL